MMKEYLISFLPCFHYKLLLIFYNVVPVASFPQRSSTCHTLQHPILSSFHERQQKDTSALCSCFWTYFLWCHSHMMSKHVKLWTEETYMLNHLLLAGSALKMRLVIGFHWTNQAYIHTCTNARHIAMHRMY